MRIIERFKRGETPSLIFRGFLPWRPSEAGRRGSRHRQARPAIETLHDFGHSDSAQTIPMRSGLR
jgi:hypothetical protein